MKKLFAVLLAVCLLASLGVTAFAGAADYGWGGLDIEKVVFADGFTSIPAEPFEGLSSVTAVVLPASVTEVEAEAFADASVATVETAGDVAVLEEVAAFADAEVAEMSQEDFNALVEEVEANATSVTDTYTYAAGLKTLLVKGTQKLAFYAYEESTSYPIYNYTYDDQGRLIAVDMEFEDGTTGRWEIEYDDQGREIAEHGTFKYADGTVDNREVKITYTSDTSRTVDYKGTIHGDPYEFSEEQELIDGYWTEVTKAPSPDESEVAKG